MGGVAMSCVIYLANRRRTVASLQPQPRHAGIILPFVGKTDAGLIVPKVRSAIRHGANSANLIGLLADKVRDTVPPGSPEPA